VNKVIKEITEYANKTGKPLKLSCEQEYKVLYSFIEKGYSVEDYLFAKGYCLKNQWIKIK